MYQVLTPHQRRVAVALLVEEIPIDVLAERLATNRNALYQTLHEVRKRLRAYLLAEGYLGTDRPQEASR
jgi:RNA polymerase sigma-70 factor (ECF subfamily)